MAAALADERDALSDAIVRVVGELRPGLELMFWPAAPARWPGSAAPSRPLASPRGPAIARRATLPSRPSPPRSPIASPASSPIGHGRHPLFRSFYGPAGQELAAEAAWPPSPAPIAVIAGTRRRAVANPTSWVSGRVFAADVAHDGTVAVDEARLSDAAFATVDATHSFIMDDAAARGLIEQFLLHGRLP